MNPKFKKGDLVWLPAGTVLIENKNDLWRDLLEEPVTGIISEDQKDGEIHLFVAIPSFDRKGYNEKVFKIPASHVFPIKSN